MFLFSRWERAVCRVKAIALSMERLLRYANCSGSSEAGSTEQVWSLMSLSKHLLKRCQSNGPPHVILFLQYGHNGGFFEAWGNHRQREGQIENVCENLPPPPILSVMESLMSAQARLYRGTWPCLIPSNESKQTNYPKCFCSVEHCIQ